MGPFPVKKESDYCLSNRLKVPRTTTYTVQTLFEQILNNDIDIEPEYQRGKVWRENKQICFIESLLRNLYVPPLVFAVNISEYETEIRTCIDGKQRLTSIYRFMEGLIPRKDVKFLGYLLTADWLPIDRLVLIFPSDTGGMYWYRNHPGVSKRKDILPQSLRRLFANKQLVCVEYSDLTNNDEREIFQRVQLGVTLSAAEKLQAINGPHAQNIRELLATHPLDNIPFDRSRATDFRCFVTLAHALTNYPKMNNILIKPSQLAKWLKSDVPKTFRTKMEETLVRMGEVSIPDKGNVSPVEVVFIGVLTNAVSDVRDLSDLVVKMRSREAHDGLCEVRGFQQDEEERIRLWQQWGKAKEQKVDKKSTSAYRAGLR
ncbi:uncharacterized protein ARMOST_22194 [Armillaria ostoyae]|uniref:GmrSD restriction endonucleases N-terminal domain-containing protein n=1 Tax=Armillaria ostoyae TaxID=47428 RepID=A0A284SC65_ARMOS|nr:uncharacterized protein ARMOST_22194 [Armillaria ostoyae]